MINLENFKSILSGLSEASILDVGTGRGNFIQQIIRVYDDYSEIIGIDTTLKSIETARNNFGDEKIQFVQMDAEDMKFKDDSFDVVCLSNSLHHLKDIGTTIAEMKRVLKPNGILVFNEMYRDNQDEKQLTHVYLHHFGAEIDRIHDVPHNETYKREEIIQTLTKEAGFEVLKSWDLDVPNSEELTEEDMKDLMESIDRTLERVKESSEFYKYEMKAEKLKERLKKVGFKGATQLMVVLK